jgi:glycosyltransferase involved in cell wall biosynthesis
VKRISIVIPVKNEAACLGKVLDDLHTVCATIEGYAVETLVVIDHCTDDTKAVVESRGVRWVENRRKAGKGFALITGFENSGGDIFIMMDGDYSHDANDLPRMIDALEAGPGMVIGSRALGGSEEYEIIRLFGNVGLTGLFRFLFGIPVFDALNGYKAFVRGIFDNFRYSSRGFEIEIELLANALRLGLEIVEIPSRERRRAGGAMKSNAARDGLRFLIAIIAQGIAFRLGRKRRAS